MYSTVVFFVEKFQSVLLKASDQIIQCEVCTRYAKSIAGSDWQEAYNAAWLKIREIELKNPSKKIRNYKTYFYSALRSVTVDQKRLSNHLVPESKVTNMTVFEIEDDEYMDIWSIESTVLHNWLNKPTKDSTVRFLQNIVNLALDFKSVKLAASKTRMSLRTFFKYLAAAKQEIENEHFSLTDSHPLNQRDLV